MFVTPQKVKIKCLIWWTWLLQLMCKKLDFYPETCISVSAALSAPGCCSYCYYTMASLWLSCIRTDYLLLSTYCWLNPLCQHPPHLAALCFIQSCAAGRKLSQCRYLFSLQRCYWFSFSLRSAAEPVSKCKKKQRYTDKALYGNSSGEEGCL